MIGRAQRFEVRRYVGVHADQVGVCHSARDRVDRPRNAVALIAALGDGLTPAVDLLALLVVHGVVLKEVLADIEVVRLHLALHALDHAAHHARLDLFAVGHTELAEEVGDPRLGEDPHQVVFQREEELRRAGVALATGATAKLIVNAPRFVTLGADYVEPAKFLNAFAQDDVGAATGHVRGNGHSALLAGARNDVRLALVLLRVEQVVGNASRRQQRRQLFALLDAGGAHQDRPTELVRGLDFVRHRRQLFALRAVDQVVALLAAHAAVGRDHDDVEIVDLAELRRFRERGSRHAAELVVQPEEVLVRDGRERLVFLADLQAFFGLRGLVQTVAPAAPLHLAAGELVNDDDLRPFAFVGHDVVLIELVEIVRLQCDVDMVNPVHVFGRVHGRAKVEQRRRIGHRKRIDLRQGAAGAERARAHLAGRIAEALRAQRSLRSRGEGKGEEGRADDSGREGLHDHGSPKPRRGT